MGSGGCMHVAGWCVRAWLLPALPRLCCVPGHERLADMLCWPLLPAAGAWPSCGCCTRAWETTSTGGWLGWARLKWRCCAWGCDHGAACACRAEAGAVTSAFAGSLHTQPHCPWFIGGSLPAGPARCWRSTWTRAGWGARRGAACIRTAVGDAWSCNRGIIAVYCYACIHFCFVKWRPVASSSTGGGARLRPGPHGRPPPGWPGAAAGVQGRGLAPLTHSFAIDLCTCGARASPSTPRATSTTDRDHPPSDPSPPGPPSADACPPPGPPRAPQRPNCRAWPPPPR